MVVTSSEAVTVERDGPVTTVRLFRPSARNAVDGITAAALADAFRAFDDDPDAAVAVLSGEGGTFCAGADLRAVGTPRGNRTEPDGDGPMGPTRLRLRKPVIAAIYMTGSPLPMPERDTIIAGIGRALATRIAAG